MATWALTLSENGQARATIVLAAGANPAEATAAREVADYLGEVTGASFPVVNEGATGGAEIAAFPMQADLYFRPQVGPVSLYLNVGLAGAARPALHRPIRPHPVGIFNADSHPFFRIVESGFDGENRARLETVIIARCVTAPRPFVDVQAKPMPQ